ncbi:MAG: zinc ribbon domain-containing protein [Planctomycetales bacterium]|nr:zinc ribbon domain-containing protein [Planctomycetales bacterium]
MPTYEYECAACEHRFDEFQMMSDPTLRRCPKCGKLRLRRLIGAGGGLIFKGSGFYITDYRSKDYADKAKAETPPAPSSSGDGKPEGGGDSVKSESKTEKKAEPKTEAKPAKTSRKKKA